MFTYQFGSNPTIDYPRLLVGDTECENHIFEDSEISAFYAIQAAQFQSGMRYSGSAGSNLPSTPVSYLRVAALMLDALASSRSRLLSVTKLLDVTLAADGSQKTAASLREQARQWREIDDNSGAFVIIEQCTTSFGFLQRFYSQVQRQNAQ
jgi:hypothetical protein